MKAFAIFLVGTFLLVGLFAQTAVVIATHPWLAVQWFVRPPTISSAGSTRPIPGVANVRPDGVPADQWALMQQVAEASPCGVTASVLAAIAKAESGFGANMSTSSAGAIGYAQFIPSTWQSVAPGGDPYAWQDAIPAIGRYLCSLGYETDRTRALNSYGGCATPLCLGQTDYATKIGDLASSYLPKVPSIVATALQWLGTPYAWGGNAPGVGLDCSGLVQQAFLAAGIKLPRTSEEQFAATQRISADQAQPGDLVFFSSDGPGATHVGIVIGSGQMIDAPEPGTVVRTESYLTPYWQGVLFGFGRVSS
jgi:hypothetical protein